MYEEGGTPTRRPRPADAAGRPRPCRAYARTAARPALTTTLAGLAAAVAAAVTTGCAAQPAVRKTAPPATRPTAAGAATDTGPSATVTDPTAAGPTAAAAPAALRPISYVRKFAFREDDELRLTVAADGTYKIVRRGGGGANSSKAGTLTPDQRRRLAAAFVGWEHLDDIYPDPGGADEVYRITIGYGDKTVTASDAALKLPQTFRDVYKELRAVVSEAGMV